MAKQRKKKTSQAMILKNKTEIRYFAGIFSSNQFVEIVICISGAYAEPCQTSVIGLFAKIVNSFQQLTILAVIYFGRKFHLRGSTVF